jgi:hypothetical protein
MHSGRGLLLVREGGQPDRPVIVVLSSGGGTVEREVLAGIEEEGVPYTVLPGEADATAQDLARAAALRSPLRVGVGVGVRGDVWVHHDMLTEPLPELGCGSADGAAARILGHNAARIVVGLPLKPDSRFRQ